MKGETDQIVLNANLVEVVALTYESERVLVKYQKVGPNARTSRRGTAQAAGYDVYSTTDREIPPEETVHFPVGLITKPEPGWCLKLYNRSSLAAKKIGSHPWSTYDRRSRLPRNCNSASSQFFEGKIILSEERRPDRC